MSLPFTLQQLRIIKAIAKEQSFKRAADLLFVSQPSLSKQVKILENQLGILLFDRKNRKVTLTESGKLFLQYTDRILSLCEETCRAMDDLKSGERGNLTVGASQTVGTYLMPRVLALFAQNYPQINLTVQVDSTRNITRNIVDRRIDIAVVGGDVPIQFKNHLTIEEFVEDELLLIIPKSHPFALKTNKIINKEDLYHLNYITLNQTSTIRKFIDNTLQANNIETKDFNIVMQLSSIEAIKTAVSLGLGVAFVSASAIEKELALETLEIIKIENIKITRTLSIVTNPECHKSKGFEYFYNELWTLKNLIK
uniref:Probable RuBisCO transcriptional regulator n=1 Tax=Triparma laevis TaxID=1534972 RepID=A0A0K2RWM9_9STRA|nr:probable RuBisCO transcriptional regulator [Triparma laevis]BAS19017.1 probable RuBisCO transcriptional regulator [Triparma laevis]